MTTETTISPAVIRSAIAEHLADQSRFRGEKAAEYPDDDRNGRAASDLSQFADDLRNRVEDDHPAIIALVGLTDGDPMLVVSRRRHRYDDAALALEQREPAAR